MTDRKAAIQYILLFLFIGIVLLSRYRGSFSVDERFLFLVLILSYVWIAFLLLVAILRFHLRLFEPLTIVSVLYLSVFIIKPIIDMHLGALVEHNVNVLPGGVRATFLFVLAYSVLYLAYFLHHRRVLFWKLIGDDNSNQTEVLESDGSRLSRLYIIWVAVYALCLLSMVTQGLSLQYIFSFGAEGERALEETSSMLLFLSNLGVTLIVLWVLILNYSNSFFWKLATTVLCAIYILMRNARWLALVFLIAPVILYYGKRKSQPRMLWVGVVGFLSLCIFAWMQSNRYGLAHGDTMVFWGLRDLTLDNILAPLETDLSTYRAFYSMVVRYPKIHPYMFGKTFSYTLIMVVPRVLWAGKPDNPVRDMIEHALNTKARVSGTAVANIGELYANFGVFGLVIGMYVFGWLLSLLKRRFFEAERKMDVSFLCLYAVIFPLLYQWVARGNFSGNFYLTIFALLPYWFRHLLYCQKYHVGNTDEI